MSHVAMTQTQNKTTRSRWITSRIHVSFRRPHAPAHPIRSHGRWSWSHQDRIRRYGSRGTARWCNASPPAQNHRRRCIRSTARTRSTRLRGGTASLRDDSSLYLNSNAATCHRVAKRQNIKRSQGRRDFAEHPARYGLRRLCYSSEPGGLKCAELCACLTQLPLGDRERTVR